MANLEFQQEMKELEAEYLRRELRVLRMKAVQAGLEDRGILASGWH